MSIKQTTLLGSQLPAKNTKEVSIKNVLLIIPEMSVGGAQRSLAKLSLEFASHHNVWLVVFNKTQELAYEHGGEYLSLSVVPGRSLLSKIAAFYTRVVRLRKLKHQLKIDVSISFLEGADYINILSRRHRLEKVVLSIRGSKMHDEIMAGYFFWLRRWVLIPFLYGRADRLVVVNRGIANELKIHYGIPSLKITILNNFYDFNEIRALSMEERQEKVEQLYNRKVLITTGRLAPEKGLKGIIEVFVELKKKQTDVCLVIVGDGEEKRDLISLCKRNKLIVAEGEPGEDQPDVLFTGNQPNVFKFLRGATAYLMNSSSEGFPNGLVEAMICEVPVVSSNCPYGPGEILAPDLDQNSWNVSPFISSSGILMPIANSEETRQAWICVLEELLVSDDLKASLIKGASKRVQAFSKISILKRWMEIINE